MILALARRDRTDERHAQATDSVLTAKAKIALFADEQVKGRLITVETVKGVVILRGKIDSSESRARASFLVEALTGVNA